MSISGVPSAPLSIGIAGLIPFVGTTVGYIWYPESKHLDWIKTQSYYGCSILSFMGAVHWGLAMADFKGTPISPKSNALRYAASTVPSLIGFFSLLSPNPTVTLSSQLAGFTGLLLADSFAHRRKLVPMWYLPMRVFLTATVSLCIGSTIFTMENGRKEKEENK